MTVAGGALSRPLQIAMMTGASRCVALTFDDGPDVTLTPRLLSILEEKQVVATFFVVGYRAAAWPDIVTRAHRDGFEIGNHSWDHPQLTSLSTATAEREIARTDAVVARLTGAQPKVLRAPYGSLSWRVGNLTNRQFIGWDVDTLDWRYPNVDRIVRVAVGQATNGSIILLHDIHAATIAAAPRIIDGLTARGFRLVTVSDLLNGGCGGNPAGFDLPPGVHSQGEAVVASTAGKAAKTTVVADKYYDPFKVNESDD